jgi:hypothetical protein
MDSHGRLKERDLDGLRAVLNAWDPIGVYLPDPADRDGHPEWPEDEYDCLRWPLVSRLERGATRIEIADFLRHELRSHFGVNGSVTDDALDQLLAWWETVR